LDDKNNKRSNSSRGGADILPAFALNGIGAATGSTSETSADDEEADLEMDSIGEPTATTNIGHGQQPPKVLMGQRKQLYTGVGKAATNGSGRGGGGRHQQQHDDDSSSLDDLF